MQAAQYPYHNSEATYSHSYILPAVLRALGRPDGPVLDLGCGNGALANDLIRSGLDVYGVDASVTGITTANSIRPGRFHLMEIGRDELPDALRDKRFRTIVSTEVVEHLYDPKSFLRLARTLLHEAGGGRLVISTPYHGYLKNLALALSGHMDKHFTVDWDGGHIKFFSRRTLETMLRNEGFTPTGFIGAGRLPYLWRSMVITAETR